MFLVAKLVQKRHSITRKTFHGNADLLQTKKNRHLATNMQNAETKVIYPTFYTDLCRSKYSEGETPK